MEEPLGGCCLSRTITTGIAGVLGVHPSWAGRTTGGARTHHAVDPGPGRTARSPPDPRLGGRRRRRGGAQRPQPRDREQAGADRLDLPRQLPPARSPTPIDRHQPNDRARQRHAGGQEDGQRPARRRPDDRRGRQRQQRDDPLEPEHQPPRPPAGPARGRSTRCPAASSRSMSTMAFAIARAVPAFAAAGTSTRNTAGQAAGGPVPAEHGQQRDPDGEREPRERRALRPEVVPDADREHDRGEPARARPARRREQQPAGAAAPTTIARAASRRTPGPPGIGLPGLPMWSTGASTRSLSAPIANWRSVIDTPERARPWRRPRPRPARRGRRRPRRGSTGTGGPGAARPRASTERASAPAATAVRSLRARRREQRRRCGPAAPRSSDVDELVEVRHEVLDQPLARVGDLGADPRDEGPQRDRRARPAVPRRRGRSSRAGRRRKRTPVRIPVRSASPSAGSRRPP